MALTTPFAQNGDKLTIPATTADGSVSYDQGFGASYALPPEEGGKFINRAQFNQLMYDTTSAVIDNSDNITAIQGDLTTAKANITTLQGKVGNLESQASTGVGYLTENLIWNIGAGGDYTTIADALRAARKYNTIADKRITLRLQANYTGGEDLTPFYGNYGIILIDGNSHNFNFSTFFLKLTEMDLVIMNLNIVGSTETAIQIDTCPQIILNTVRINTGASLPLFARNSRLKIMGISNFSTTGETAISLLGGHTEIVASTTYSSTAQDIKLDGGSIVYSFSPATANIAKNTPTRQGIFFN